jgi:hypothetical protein
MKYSIFIIITVLFLACNPGTQRKENDSQKDMANLYLRQAKLSDTYKVARMEVEKLRINAKLADSLLIDSDRVIDEFNEKIGVDIGRVDKLSEVKSGLANADSTYLKFVLLNIASHLALIDAAEINSKMKQ